MDAETKVRAIVHRAARDEADEADLLGYLFGEIKPLRLVGAIRQPAAPKAKPQPGTTPPEMPMGIPAADCGSPKGAQAHHRAGEELCDVCASWSAKRHARTRVPPGSRCGSRAGAQKHRDLGERVCEECREAEAAAGRDRDRHGRPGTYTNDGCRCDKCRAAHTAYQARMRAGKREAPGG